MMFEMCGRARWWCTPLIPAFGWHMQVVSQRNKEEKRFVKGGMAKIEEDQSFSGAKYDLRVTVGTQVKLLN